jgi:thiamine-monophosphate kinase
VEGTSESLADIGEFGLIRRIHELLQREGSRTSGVTLGIGDDAASFLPRPGHEILVTCDCMVEGRHFLSGRISPYDLGRRAMVLNISDIGAMGGQPLYALVSLGLKKDLPVGDIEAMYRGFLAEINPFGASVIGGNLTESGNGLFIDITLIGEAPEGKVVRRSGAKPGNSILVTGFPGQSAAGLQLLLSGKLTEDLENDPLVRAFNVPTHRAREGGAVALTGRATAMIDTSDGFLGDLGHICEESRVGAILFQEKLPISEELRQSSLLLGVDPYEMFLGESDDYELIMTCSSEHVREIRSTIQGLTDQPVTEVGMITDAAEGVRLILRDGTERRMKAAGWDHFAKLGR